MSQLVTSRYGERKPESHWPGVKAPPRDQPKYHIDTLIGGRKKVKKLKISYNAKNQLDFEDSGGVVQNPTPYGYLSKPQMSNLAVDKQRMDRTPRSGNMPRIVDIEAPDIIPRSEAYNILLGQRISRKIQKQDSNDLKDSVAISTRNEEGLYKDITSEDVLEDIRNLFGDMSDSLGPQSNVNIFGQPGAEAAQRRSEIFTAIDRLSQASSEEQLSQGISALGIVTRNQVLTDLENIISRQANQENNRVLSSEFSNGVRSLIPDINSIDNITLRTDLLNLFGALLHYSDSIPEGNLTASQNVDRLQEIESLIRTYFDSEHGNSSGEYIRDVINPLLNSPVPDDVGDNMTIDGSEVSDNIASAARSLIGSDTASRRLVREFMGRMAFDEVYRSGRRTEDEIGDIRRNDNIFANNRFEMNITNLAAVFSAAYNMQHQMDNFTTNMEFTSNPGYDISTARYLFKSFVSRNFRTVSRMFQQMDDEYQRRLIELYSLDLPVDENFEPARELELTLRMPKTLKEAVKRVGALMSRGAVVVDLSNRHHTIRISEENLFRDGFVNPPSVVHREDTLTPAADAELARPRGTRLVESEIRSGGIRPQPSIRDSGRITRRRSGRPVTRSSTRRRQ